MKKSITALLCILLSSCFKTDIRQYETWNLDPFTKVSGYQVNRLPRQYNVFNAGIFLNKYDETMWADTDNYYSDFSDIKFEFHGPVFISFFNIVALCFKVSNCFAVSPIQHLRSKNVWVNISGTSSLH